MKVAVIGNGNVGMAAFGELLRMPEIRELTLTGRNVARIQAEVDDYADAQVLHTVSGVKISGGSYLSLWDMHADHRIPFVNRYLVCLYIP